MTLQLRLDSFCDADPVTTVLATYVVEMINIAVDGYVGLLPWEHWRLLEKTSTGLLRLGSIYHTVPLTWVTSELPVETSTTLVYLRIYWTCVSPLHYA